eukprot:Sspe_Gene.48426::Locus_25200_Transcript_2_3_Confidence_0.400_Length_1334::g.48426::m.48426/K01705/LYS4; homoaconitate hydratase
MRVTRVLCYQQNVVEKIVQRYAVDGSGNPLRGSVKQGDFVSIKPERVMTHDNTSAVIGKFRTLGEGLRVADPEQVFIGLDHDVQNKSETNQEKYRRIEAFAREMGIAFSPAGNGIVHQVLTESGLAFPGTMVVASDSHSNMYGGVGCLGTPVVRTDAAAIWATGQTWWTVPPVARVTLTGNLPEGACGKDIIITLCGAFNNDEVLNHAIEFDGDGVHCLSIDDRLAIANMTTEWGALAGIFPVDQATVAWLHSRKRRYKGALPFPVMAKYLSDDRLASLQPLSADPGAHYAVELTLDLSTVTPSVAGPNSVKKMTPVGDLSHVKINKAYIVSCVNSRASDLASAAKAMEGKRVAPGVELYIAPASEDVRREAQPHWEALLAAGAIPLPAGCGPCVGLGAGLLEDGEVGISATNRNFKG